MREECDANDECDGFSMRDFGDGNGKVGWCFKHRLTNGNVATDHDFYVKNQGI